MIVSKERLCEMLSISYTESTGSTVSGKSQPLTAEPMDSGYMIDMPLKKSRFQGLISPYRAKLGETSSWELDWKRPTPR